VQRDVGRDVVLVLEDRDLRGRRIAGVEHGDHGRIRKQAGQLEKLVLPFDLIGVARQTVAIVSSAWALDADCSAGNVGGDAQDGVITRGFQKRGGPGADRQRARPAGGRAGEREGDGSQDAGLTLKKFGVVDVGTLHAAQLGVFDKHTSGFHVSGDVAAADGGDNGFVRVGEHVQIPGRVKGKRTCRRVEAKVAGGVVLAV